MPCRPTLITTKFTPHARITTSASSKSFGAIIGVSSIVEWSCTVRSGPVALRRAPERTAFEAENPGRPGVFLWEAGQSTGFRPRPDTARRAWNRRRTASTMTGIPAAPGSAMTAPIKALLKPHVRDIGNLRCAARCPRSPPASSARSSSSITWGRHAAARHADVRPHPHIGLATVTYLFDGAILHRDSLGSLQEIVPGDVNWMTAGRGSSTPNARPTRSANAATPCTGSRPGSRCRARTRRPSRRSSTMRPTRCRSAMRTASR